MKGFYRCQKCLPCQVSKKQPKKRSSFHSRRGMKYDIRKLITCNTTHVTYVIECPCRLQYVGRTTRPLCVRIREHINNIKKGFPKHNLSKHFDEFHQRDPSGLIFYGIDTIEDHWRGGSKKIQISQNETRWIHRLDSLVPRGLNVDIDLRGLISIGSPPPLPFFMVMGYYAWRFMRVLLICICNVLPFHWHSPFSFLSTFNANI